MTNTEIKNKIEALQSDLTFSQEDGDMLCIEVSKDTLKDFLTKLKDDTDLSFDYLFALTGMDFGEDLGVIYHLESTKHRNLIQITVKISDRENPEIDSIHEVFPAAYYNEMEAHEFFGIKFKGHPDLKHLFLPEDWDKGYPLRKDYTDINMFIR
jgi:NADH:ubiquinone oxidoreductase subunit C